MKLANMQMRPFPVLNCASNLSKILLTSRRESAVPMSSTSSPGFLGARISLRISFAASPAMNLRSSAMAARNFSRTALLCAALVLDRHESGTSSLLLNFSSFSLPSDPLVKRT